MERDVSNTTALKDMREKVAALPRYSVRPNGNEIGMRMTRTGEWYFGPDVLRIIDAMIAGEEGR